MFYWDTSATATIAYTEIFSALRRHVRETVLRESQYDEVARRFLREWPAYVRVNLDERILECTRALLERYPLRTLDAIHLASAIKMQDHLDEPSVFISADTQLLRAATAEHLETKRLPL